MKNYYKSGFSVSGGIGAGTAVHGALCANFSAEVQSKGSIIGLLMEGNYQSGGGFLGGSYPNDRCIQQAFYYGRRLSSKKSSLAACVGVGMLSFREKDPTKPVRYDWFSTYYQTKTTDVVGADLILKGTLRRKGNGLGLALHTNINKHRSFVNLTLFVQLGIVWHEKPGDARRE